MTSRSIRSAVAAVLALAGLAAQAATVEVRPTADYVWTGNVVPIDVVVRLDDGERLGSYAMAITWQPAWLSFNSLSFDGFLGGPANADQAYVFGISSVIVNETALAGTAAQDGHTEFRLFRFVLNANAIGVSPLEFVSAQLFDADGAPLSVVALDSTLTTVPGPATGALLASALGLAGTRLRRRRG